MKPCPVAILPAGLLRAGFTLTALVLALATPRAHALDANGQRLLAEAQTHLKNLETNLQLAVQTAGPGAGAVPASKAKLAAVRLGSAKQLVPQVQARLERLPAGDAEVAAVRQRFDATVAQIAALESRLTGGAPAPTPAAAGAKLDYRQEETLKNARFYVREIEGHAAALADVAEQVKDVADIVSIDHRLLARAINTVNAARERGALVRGYLDALPADGQGVAEVAAAFKTATESIASSESVIAPLQQKLGALIDPANHPRLAADMARLQELAAMFADESVLLSDRTRAASIVAERAAAIAEHTRITTAYAALLRQETADGTRLAGISRHFTEQLAQFDATAQQQRTNLPAEIESELTRVMTMADEAVAQQRHAWFGGGIPQHVGFIEDKLALLSALDPEAAKGHAARLEQTRAQLKQKQSALHEAIIVANELPPDRYTGGDRAQLADIALGVWLKNQPGAKVLGVRIPSEAWKRDVRWRNQTGDWYKIDRSRLQVQLLVRHDDRLAVVRAIDLWKNHLEGDRITGSPVSGPDEPLEPRDFLLLKKVP